ncbi:MAG: NHL repeat-containing protein, partial [Chloroflexaceae bacterium]
GAWAASAAELYAAILASVRFFPPQTATPATGQQAEQPPILATGPAGFVLRLGGSGGPPRGRFVSARGLATAPDGTLYLAESSRGVWVFAPDGALIGTFGGEELLDAYDVARAPEGDLFVADYGRNAIVRFRADGTFEGRWGGPGNAPEQFGFSSPQRIALGPDGSVYALDTRPGPESGRVVSSVARFDPEGGLRERIALPADLAPADLAVDGAGFLYLADSFSGVVVKLDPRGAEVARFGDPAARESFAGGAIDLDEQGNIYVADYRTGRIQQFDPQGNFLNLWIEEGTPQFNPSGKPTIFSLAVSRDGILYMVHDGRIFRRKVSDGSSLPPIHLEDISIQQVNCTSDGKIGIVANGD